MAQHNPGGRAYLLIVLGGIVIGFVIAAYLLSGDKSETGAKMDKEQPATEQPAEAEAPMAPEVADEMPADDAGMSDEVSPPDGMADDVMPEDGMPDASMSDGMSPPDEMTEEAMPDEGMPDEGMPDEAPDAMMPDENPEEAVPESPPAAPNP